MDLLICLTLALLIHAAPIALKVALDPLYVMTWASLFTLFALISLQISLLTLPGKKGRVAAFTLLVPLALTTLLNIVSLVIFTSPVSLSGVFSILQSNSEEAMEFASAYLSSILWTTLIVCAVAAAGFKIYWNQLFTKGWKIPASMLTLSLWFGTPILIKAFREPTLAAWDLHEVAYADRIFTSLLRYRGQMKAWEVERQRWQNRGNVATDLDLKVVDPKKLAPLVILVIGESTTRHNMQLYGYHRPTTPKLSAMRDDLLVFEDVITPAAHTIPAVMSALCSEKIERGNINCTKATLIDIARSAGYRVSWISNQTAVGFDDNVLVHLGKSADETIFVNRDVSSAAEADRNTSLDEKIFKPLDETLLEAEDPSAKQLIIIHLMGAHFTYEKRYPLASRIFGDHFVNDLDPSIKDAEANLLINNYDNAIAYQDEILSRIFTRIKHADRDALGFYFSDHGEEVYHTKNFHGHNDTNLTPAMSEIPLIVATSDVYKRNHPAYLETLQHFQDRPFTTNRLTPSIAALLGLSYKNLDLERSLFSPEFKVEPRETANGIYVPQHDRVFGQK